jgi:hypothetical protein
MSVVKGSMAKFPAYDGRFMLVRDGDDKDSEWYVIPVSRIVDWQKLVSSTKDEDLPDYAYHIGKEIGSITFADWRIERG